ncbi:uncharacterized protein EV154DRAFT_486744 [Mucor mucedo]|uniref:uncharacterized protein n=1 Tax=Mucor mucedo TaxID=29922 RepID=UPI00221F4498|nr:uncharacterized protein EV154DRAFT_486744 [Mucor mucedo]KAI7875360.1 hypothetical protein EV154DRAFT_486744 [Mucor mucedo]
MPSVAKQGKRAACIDESVCSTPEYLFVLLLHFFNFFNRAKNGPGLGFKIFLGARSKHILNFDSQLLATLRCDFFLFSIFLFRISRAFRKRMSGKQGFGDQIYRDRLLVILSLGHLWGSGHRYR